MQALFFKILQRKLKFRNPNHILQITPDMSFARADILEAEKYLERLRAQGTQFTFPTDENYPKAFHHMKEPPLFIEYLGPALWRHAPLFSVVGSREISNLTQKWMKSALSSFIERTGLITVSGGARGVDQCAHLTALKQNCQTVFVLPSGLSQMYPENLQEFRREEFAAQACFLSEFESGQKIHKSHFYFRNRLIAALGDFTLVTQASLKSGSLLTVHHALENGKPVVVVPAHPEHLGFEGNLKLLREGAYPVANEQDLLDFWSGEFHSK